MSKNHIFHLKTKHILIKFHFLREEVTNQIVELEYIPTKEKVVDILSKPLPRYQLEYLRKRLGVVPPSFLH